MCYVFLVPLSRSEPLDPVGTSGATMPLPSRGALGLMFDRVFGTLFWGKMFAVVAVWTHGLVAAVVMYDATRSALMVGLVGVVQFAPQLILAPTSGKWADTGNPARQILLGRVFCVFGSGSIAVWMYAVPTLEGMAVAIPILLGTTLVGIGFVVGGPGSGGSRAGRYGGTVLREHVGHRRSVGGKSVMGRSEASV